MDQQQATFDVFLSYADADRAWVETSLIPQLRTAGVAICTARETFDIGVPRLVNRERAVEQSRHTLIVLSPAWLASEWAEFEGLLAQTHDPAARSRHVLPLLLHPCQLPRRIAMLHAADFTIPEQREAQIQRVIAAITGTLHLSRVSAPLSVLLGPEGRNRSAMLRKVRTIWIDGLLTHSLYQETLIALGLHERPDAVARPLDVLVQLPNRAASPLPPDTRIVEVFDECDGALLILGAPGAGKTTMLLELARDLLDRAEQDPTHPIPVVFPLSSWAERRVPLVEWLADELNKRYDVPQKLAQAWVSADGILPVLDGLDEVKAEVRRACVEAINRYRQEHGLLPLVVSSRSADYDALSVKLRLHGAIMVQPLTREQVKTYLRQIGLHMTPSNTSPLWDLLDTPLMLNIATLTYVGQDGQHLPTDGTPEAQRERLFTAYVARMFQRRSATQRFPQDQTLHWLAWLAWQMQRHNQTVFYLERMQPVWLPPQDRRVLRLLYILLFGLGLGLVGALVGTLVFREVGAPTLGLSLGLGLGLLIGLVFGVLVGQSSEQEMTLTDTMRWSWTGMRRGLVMALLTGLVAGLGFVPVFGLRGGLLYMVIMVLFGGLIAGLSGVEVERRTRPNQGIHRSGQSALLVGLSFGVVVGLVLGVGSGLGFGLILGVLGGLVAALLVGLQYGGHTWFRHYLLRLLLIRQDVMPWCYVQFLDFAAQRILLRKVGGGYIFIHRMLLDYFAAQYTGPETTERTTSRKST